jgi:hypothetical protein
VPSEALTVACVWVRGNVPFTADYVLKLRRMVGRHLAAPHRFVCLTDQPDELPGVECSPVPTPQDMFGWWSKMHLFEPGRLSGRVLYLDLDTVVLGSLDDLLIGNSSLTLIPPAGDFAGRGMMRTVRRYNSSVMCFWAEDCGDLWEQWRPELTRELWGDQDFIGLARPSAGTWRLSWFPRLSEVVRDPSLAREARVLLCKKPKNHLAAALHPIVRDNWR